MKLRVLLSWVRTTTTPRKRLSGGMLNISKRKKMSVAKNCSEISLTTKNDGCRDVFRDFYDLPHYSQRALVGEQCIRPETTDVFGDEMPPLSPYTRHLCLEGGCRRSMGLHFRRPTPTGGR